MKTKLKIACTLTALSFVGNVMAESASPSAVTGITATANGTSITATWDSVTSDPIAYYRVYYSAQSILDNEGLFDDFEVTDEDETSLTFTAPSGMTEVFVSVIAVANSGLESEFFTEEAMVIVDTEEPSIPQAEDPIKEPSLPLPPPPPKSEPESMEDIRLLKAEVLSPTQIIVTFSAPLTVDQAKAPEGLKIDGPNDTPLQIKSITIDRDTIAIITDTQTRGTVYNVQFREPFVGRSGQALDATDRSALVTGHSDGAEPPVAAPVRAVDPQSPPDIEDVTMVPQIQQNGAYSITIEWTVDNSPGDLHGIVVYQTRDGRTFGPPSLLPIDIGGIQLTDVTPGFYGMYIQTINVYGYVSPGVFQYANLPQYIPGYGFSADLTFGRMDANGEMVAMEMNEPKEEPKENMATIEVITKDTPTETIAGVDHSAAADIGTTVHWKNAAVLAGGTTVVILMLVSAFLFIPKRSSDAL